MIDFSCCTVPANGNVELMYQWQGNLCRVKLRNTGAEPIRAGEVVLFRGAMPYSPDTAFYGESANMLTQYEGTLRRCDAFTNLTDHGHYKLPRTEGFFSCYNLWMLFPVSAPAQLAGFSSCRRFVGEFRFSESRFEVVMLCENIIVAPGETVELEEFYSDSDGNREILLDRFGEAIRRNHPRLDFPERVTGWCSWYCYGPAVTERDIMDNLAALRDKLPALRFVQIDDGYQPTMGDWLLPSANFPSGVSELCAKISAAGFEPAIWVAPFIASADSVLFREHPEYFITGDDGKPLPSNRDSFGGWRLGPWYMLDGTHPGAREFLRGVFRTMRNEWGCRYFKLDANFWGAMPFGHCSDPDKTHVEAYRMGMEAVREGAGEDSLLLGCNAPMWPSLGVCHAMRISGDILRQWPAIKQLAKECFGRMWQNRHLWTIDPDCVVMENLPVETITPDGRKLSFGPGVSANEYSYHLAHILASGGMLLSGDRIPDMSAESIGRTGKLLEAYGHTARFTDGTFTRAEMELPGRKLYLFFNACDYAPSEHVLPSGPLFDYWTGEPVTGSALFLPQRSARVLYANI